MHQLIRWIGLHFATSKPRRPSPLVDHRTPAGVSAGQKRWSATADRGRSRRLFGCFAALAISCFLLPLGALDALSQSAPNQPPANKDAAALQQAIRDYILAHPEVIIQSLQQAKLRAEQRQAALIKSKIIAFRKDLLDNSNAPVLGNPNGDVTLVEFFDYRCPYCRQVEPWVQTFAQARPGRSLGA